MNIFKSITYRFNHFFNKDANDLFLKQYSFIDRNTFPFFFKARYYVNALKETCNAQFRADGNKVIVQINDLQFLITNEEEIYILSEIFINGVYNFNTSTSCSVIDIGMNIGIASIFFASIKEVDQVYSFELFQKTYSHAIYNFDLNPHLKSKIIPHNFGLGKGNESVKIPYTEDQKANMGVAARIKQNVETNISMQDIILRDSFEVIKDILSKNSSEVIIKMDCEGSEYDIFNSLSKLDFQKIKSFMIEWHYKGPEPILDVLRRNNYFVYSFSPKSSTTGMIYATKVKQ